jgi:hypothetical protein
MEALFEFYNLIEKKTRHICVLCYRTLTISCTINQCQCSYFCHVCFFKIISDSSEFVFCPNCGLRLTELRKSVRLDTLTMSLSLRERLKRDKELYSDDIQKHINFCASDISKKRDIGETELKRIFTQVYGDCPVCFEPILNGPFKIISKCDHMVCSKCMQNIRMQREEKLASKILCPLCRGPANLCCNIP